MNMKKLMMMVGAAIAMVQCGGAAEKPALAAEDIKFEKRSDGLVDIRFRMKNDLVKDGVVLARVRAHYIGWMMLDTNYLYRADPDGSRGALVGCDVQLRADETDVRLVWDAKRDMPHELTLDAAIKEGLWIAVDLEPQPLEVRVKCQNGVMVGEQHGAGIAAGCAPRTLTFFGVPFAKPPVGPRRWKAPEWPDASDAEILAKKFAPSPIQKVATDETSSSTRCHEDCLYLNLWTGWTDDAQPIKGNENKPVLVFIHGGAFALGGAKESMNDCSRLAERYGKDVIFVTIEYRLGLFGFFDFSGVPGWSYEKYPDHGRIMLLDQQMALKWLKRNIRAFGGDPDRITIAGESAGGISVSLLMANFNRDDDGEMLFRRAIPMSGAFNIFSRETFRRINMGQLLCEALTKTAGRPFRTMDDLQNATEEEMWKAFLFPIDKIESPYKLPPLCQNKIVGDLILGPLAEGDARDGSDKYACIGTNAYAVIRRNAKDVDLFTGDVAQESRYWANCFLQPEEKEPLKFYYENYVPMVIESYRQFGSEAVDQYIRQIDEADDHDPKLNFGYSDIWSKTALISEMQFRIPQIRLASAYADSATRGKGRVFMYHFRMPQLLKDRMWVRSMHASELPYLFDHQKFTDYGPLDRSLQKRFSEMMVEFVKTGEPRYRNEGGELALVPEYRTVGDERKTVVVGEDGVITVESDPWSWQRKLLQPVSERVPPGIF